VDRISQLRGRILTIKIAEKPYLVMPTYHPAALLYNARYKPEIQQDFLKIRQLLDQ
jgi:DNA polymerase